MKELINEDPRRFVSNLRRHEKKAWNKFKGVWDLNL